MIILIEGPDGAGKTTLVKDHFAEFEYHHFGPFPTPQTAFQTYASLLDDIERKRKDETIVIDRMHLSERVYGEVYHGRYMQEQLREFLEMRLEELQGICITCLPKLETVLANWRSNLSDQMVQDEQQMIEIYHEYANVAKYTTLPLMFFDYENTVYNTYYPPLDRALALRHMRYA